ncbi:hypothetical protein VP01_335g10 [Puccinia sorghi]|uniref:Uncharacterized protein n=1 Tax=Puccinia sorghi TaxID=27349 RepID=A0A0L6UWX1_9BASI|nr:hypothetical protein VP01_335g10 [Puccinia sorghi]
MDASMIAKLQANHAQRDQMIQQLLQHVEAMELRANPTQANAAQTTQHQPTNQNRKKKESTKKKVNKTAVATPKLTMKKPATLGASKKTPVKQHAQSATPSLALKKSPLQMMKKDHPEGFEHTKAGGACKEGGKF